MLKNLYRVIETVGQVYIFEVLAENELEAVLLVRSGEAGRVKHTEKMKPVYKASLVL